MGNSSDLMSSCIKAFKNKIKDYDDLELLNEMDSIKESKYANKVLSRIKSDKESNKKILCIHNSIIFDKQGIINDKSVIEWLESIIESKNNFDVFIVCETAHDKDAVSIMRDNLHKAGLKDELDSDINFVKSVIDDSIFIYKKAYIYQGKLPSIDTLIEISDR